MEKPNRRQYSPQFREAAVRSVLDQGHRIADAARRLEVSEKTLGNWVYAARRGNQPTDTAAATPPKVLSVNELEMEVYKLRSENTQLKIDKEILKKAAAFFVKESH